MDFTLTQEQLLIRDMVREFAEKEVKPIAAEIDRDQRYPTETVEQMKALGLFGLSIPEEYGGGGGDTVSYAVACEELARVCASHSAILSVHITGIKSILLFGTEEQKKKYIPDMASGKKIACFCLTEPAEPRRTARRQVHPEWLKGFHHQRQRGRHLLSLCDDAAGEETQRNHRVHCRSQHPRIWHRSA
jgi:alkylation response protein AidB-like acyl-CoA dehydrogenase